MERGCHGEENHLYFFYYDCPYDCSGVLKILLSIEQVETMVVSLLQEDRKFIMFDNNKMQVVRSLGKGLQAGK
jgi:hypothetical protein